MFSHSSKKKGAGKSEKHVHPSADEVVAYRRALITGIPYRELVGGGKLQRLRPPRRSR